MPLFDGKTNAGQPRGAAVNPNTVHDAEPEHDHEDKRSAVADERKWNASDRQNRNRHANVLKDVRENESGDSDDEQQSELVTGTERDEETGQQKQGESAQEKHPADKTPLFADGGENVIVVHRGSGKKTELDLRIGRFEAFAGPAAGADGDKRLIDRPG